MKIDRFQSTTGHNAYPNSNPHDIPSSPTARPTNKVKRRKVNVDTSFLLLSVGEVGVLRRRFRTNICICFFFSLVRHSQSNNFLNAHLSPSTQQVHGSMQVVFMFLRLSMNISFGVLLLFPLDQNLVILLLCFLFVFKC
jgi:hypothetical protein